MANNISNPLSAGKSLDFKTFENLAKNKAIDGKATIGIATDSSGRTIIGLSANVGGKKVQQLGKAQTDLSKISPAQRNGVLATQAFKQALVQRYGETIANAVDKHLVKSGHARILTADDLRKNLKVAAAIVKILKQQPNPTTAQSAAEKANQLSERSTRRQEDGSPSIPSAPPRSRSASTNSSDSVNQFFAGREQPPAYRSTEDLRPSAPPRSRSASEVSEIDQAGNQWHHNTLFVSPDEALELAGESASLPEDPVPAKAAQRPRAKALSQAELEASFDDFLKLLDEKNSNSGKI